MDHPGVLPSRLRILGNLDWQGAPMVFTVKCVKFLIDSECLVGPKREHPAFVLFDTLGMGCGPEKHKQIDSLIGVLDDVCHEPAPPVTASPNVPAPTPSAPVVQTIDTPLDKQIPTVLLEDVTAEIAFFPLVNYPGIKFYDGDYAAATQALLRAANVR